MSLATYKLQTEGELVALFDNHCIDGVNAAIGVQHTGLPNLGAAGDIFNLSFNTMLWGLTRRAVTLLY